MALNRVFTAYQSVGAVEMRLKKAQKPSWIMGYEQPRQPLVDIGDHLATHLTRQTIPDKAVRALKLDLLSLDYLTGDTITDPTAAHTPFFMPTNENVPHERQHRFIQDTFAAG